MSSNNNADGRSAGHSSGRRTSTENKTVANRKKIKLGNDKDTKVMEELECSICLDFSASPIYNCDNGHITCGTCYEKLLTKQCPQCQTGMEISPFAEHLAKKLNVQIDCANAIRGCSNMVNSIDMSKHLNECYYRDVVCELMNCQGVKVPCSALGTHLNDCHQVRLYILDPATHQMDLAIECLKPLGANDEREFRRTKVIRMNGKEIFLNILRNQEAMYLYLTMFGDETEAAKYRYTLKVFKSSLKEAEGEVNNTAKEYPVLPFYDYYNYNSRPLENCVVIPITKLGDFVKQENGKVVYKCSLEIKHV